MFFRLSNVDYFLYPFNGDKIISLACLWRSLNYIRFLKQQHTIFKFCLELLLRQWTLGSVPFLLLHNFELHFLQYRQYSSCRVLTESRKSGKLREFAHSGKVRENSGNYYQPQGILWVVGLFNRVRTYCNKAYISNTYQVKTFEIVTYLQRKWE